MSLYRLTKFELKKLFKQKPAYAGFIVVIVICILYFILNYVNRPVGSYRGMDFVMDTIYIQNNALLILPFIAILSTVHAVCEEFSRGTVRTVVTKPVKRENFIIGKFLALLVYMCCISYSILIVSSLCGLRWGYADGFVTFLPRLVFIYFLYTLGTLVLAAFTLAVATLGTTPVVTAFAALGFHRVVIILESFVQLREYTFTYHVINSIQFLMARSINTRTLYESLVAILIYILALLLIASFLLEKRDITA